LAGEFGMGRFSENGNMPKPVKEETIGGKVVLGICEEYLLNGEVGLASRTLAGKRRGLVAGWLFVFLV
jgi:hypothetical protein